MSIFNNKYSLKSLNDAQKLKLIGFLILLTVCTWFLLIYSKINKQISQNINLLQQINTKNSLIEQSSNKCAKLEKKVADIRSEISCSNNKDIKKEIINYAKEANLTLKSYMLLSTTETNAKTQQDIVSYEFMGKIDQIIAFLHKLSLSKSCLECQEINISKKTDTESSIKCVIKLLNKQNKATK
jgi:hypothetical protein